MSLFSMDHCKKESTLQLFSGSINVLNECRIDEENVLVEVTQSFFFRDLTLMLHVESMFQGILLLLERVLQSTAASIQECYF